MFVIRTMYIICKFELKFCPDLGHLHLISLNKASDGGGLLLTYLPVRSVLVVFCLKYACYLRVIFLVITPILK